ncbi:MAG: c-type cytochrome [Hyphomicrobiaceae bacterium]
MNRVLLFSAIGATALLGATVVSAQDAENGAEVFKRCRACHDVGENAKNKVGPILNGIVGRKAGTIEGFAYSEANRKAGADGWVWTEEKMMEYLLNPRAAMPGNKMAFAGIKDEQDRKDLIAYLKKFSK